jgi:hypothetical protein
LGLRNQGSASRQADEYQDSQQFDVKEAGKSHVSKTHDKQDSTPRDSDVNETEDLLPENECPHRMTGTPVRIGSPPGSQVGSPMY